PCVPLPRKTAFHFAGSRHLSNKAWRASLLTAQIPAPISFVNETTPSHSADDTAPGGRVLVLEPDLDLAEQIRNALREAASSAEVDVAPTLAQAHEIILRAKPDLFVLDIDAVPDIGQEFLYDLRTSHPNARAIVLTGGHLASHQEQVAGLGAIHFLEKPFPHGDFVALVEALLSPS